MPLILNNDGTIYTDVPSIEEIIRAMNQEFVSAFPREQDVISILSYEQFMEMYYGTFQNHRGEASDSRELVPQEAQAGRPYPCTYGRTASGEPTKALPMGAIVGIGGRVEEETS